MSLDQKKIYVGVLKNLRIPKGNGEKLTKKTSNIIERTGKVCCNCLSGECDDTRYGTNGVICMDPNSDKKGLLNSPTSTCFNYS